MTPIAAAPNLCCFTATAAGLLLDWAVITGATADPGPACAIEDAEIGGGMIVWALLSCATGIAAELEEEGRWRESISRFNRFKSDRISAAL